MLFFCLSHTNPVSFTYPHSSMSFKGKSPLGMPISSSKDLDFT
ncbi:hypothetical protein ERO13_A13G113001v2 [Gossypium hirsutum]|uniref:Uncharacterized protein n=2 Tax=Gossypium TaxID=3633 RepID=A0A5J5T1V7_GOSBA|nr:hypothetical protein ES319_D13G133300v1 [Gossypium barbadense]KAB2048694.1 hypothetical protein ES319_A13G128500v1 [Gossypium barbadense]KAG4166150.1 hypothetical protein ERO13_A13G113001v2 [Gossypium hirsutum]TYI46909.1 hypothetical protein E1A91_D13G136300v1 [Gossypium mustelinum]